MTPKIRVDIVSDVMCPWCYIGKRNLEQAIEIFDDVKFEIHWRPYQLDPTLPPEGRDRRQYLENKFGGAEQAKTVYQRVEEAGQVAGIKFKFADILVAPNTLDAHRVTRWAAGISDTAQDHVVEQLFRNYFLEGKNIGDHEVLADAAAAAGMDRATVLDLLASDEDQTAVENEIGTAQQMGVAGVPFFIFDQKYSVSGAQPPQVLSEIINRVVAPQE